MQELTHTPTQPSFDCSVCDEPWPCAPAKVELAEEYLGHGIALAIYMSIHLDNALREAIADHEWGRVDDLYDRFLGWVRRGPKAEDPHAR
ncbi:hypothetical protein [Actinoplanes sp. NPDC051859]|uniref:hypothetical protein n=1 Tax=Actinoplanes sp. NPDC051859 TaxID=3363909 RepID=UPI0037A0721C